MEIDNNRPAPAVTQNSGQGAPVENQGSGSTDTSSGSSAQISQLSDRVSLTGEARQLQELEKQVASEPVVDSQRVASVREAVENGTFTVNPERIAEKMLTIEQALTDAR